MVNKKPTKPTKTTEAPAYFVSDVNEDDEDEDEFDLETVIKKEEQTDTEQPQHPQNNLIMHNKWSKCE